MNVLQIRDYAASETSTFRSVKGPPTHIRGTPFPQPEWSTPRPLWPTTNHNGSNMKGLKIIILICIIYINHQKCNCTCCFNILFQYLINHISEGVHLQCMHLKIKMLTIGMVRYKLIIHKNITITVKHSRASNNIIFHFCVIGTQCECKAK
jgi:hypothetical protein